MGDVNNELDRLDRRVTRQEDLFGARDQVLRDLVSDMKSLTKSVEAMPAQFAAEMDMRFAAHKAQNCDTHSKNDKPKTDEKPQGSYEMLIRVIYLLVGIICTLMGVKVGL